MKRMVDVKWAVWIGLMVGALGCGEEASDVGMPGREFGLAAVNGLSAINGLSAVNGLSAMNGLSSVNGLSLTNGLSSVNGLASTSGLMTTPMGRRTVSYIASCALGPGQTLVKGDQYGNAYSYAGSVGLAPNWLNGTPSSTDEANVSACMIARLNSAGMHVPLWMDAAPSSVGWGTNSSYPVQEGAYFGNVMRANSDGTVHAYYCEGRDYTKGLVPGRLGADAFSNIYQNPFGAGALCDDHCTAHGSDGYTSCNGVANPITVWRQASYNPVFDNNYVYELVNVSSGLALDVYGRRTAEGTPVDQYTYNDTANQHFQIFQVASSQWKIIDLNSGKAITNRNGASSNVAINTYEGAATDNWAFDDHNGHFIIRNKATNAYLQASTTATSAYIGVTTNYVGGPDTDWDLYAVDSL